MLKIINQRIIIISLLFIIIEIFNINNLNANNLDNNDLDITSNNIPQKTRIYIADIIIGQGVDTTLLYREKVFQAFNFMIMMQQDKYELVPLDIVEQAAHYLDTATEYRDKDITYFDIAKILDANQLCILKIEQLINVIRCEIISANPQKSDSAKTSDGYAILHLFKKKDNMPLFDPTLLEAIQKAFANSENTPLMWMDFNEPYNVKPAPALVICGWEFINDLTLHRWHIFDNPVVSSYEYIELAFEKIYKSKDWLVYDNDSRDGIYMNFNLVLPENNIAPSYNELAALRRFGINNYLLGKVERVKKGVQFTLTLYENTQAEQKIIRSVSEILTKDSYTEAKKIIQKLTEQVIN